MNFIIENASSIFLLLALNILVQGIIRGNAHLNYLADLFPEQFSEISYPVIFLKGSFHKAPQLLIPYVKKYPNLTDKQNQLYRKTVKRIWIEISSILVLIVYFTILILLSDSDINAI